jgi:hypothetical protein
MPFVPQAVTSSYAFPYSWQVSRIGTGHQIDQVERRFVMKRIIAKAFTMAVVATLALGVAPTANARDKECSNATLKGTFVHTATGFVTSPGSMASPFAAVSTITYDGNGAFTETGVLSLNGNIVPAQTDPAVAQTVTGPGTYTVNPDCTGTYTVQIPSLGLTAHGFFVIADGGNEFQLIETDPGTIVVGVVRRQFPVVR